MERNLTGEFDDILARRVIHPVYQPIVSLVDCRVVGFEALARGPDKSRYQSPAALFAEAERRGVTATLDWICMTTSTAAALDSPLRDVPLFVNVDPATFGTPCPIDLLPLYHRGRQELDLVVEITERRGGRPESMLRQLASFRQAGGRIAIDDVGVDPMSLNVVSVLAPDVIKLDRSVTQLRTSSWARTSLINAVQAEAQATGAAVLCEGIETIDHLQTALAMGATLGQGWLFGRPGPLPSTVERSSTPLPRVTPYPKFAASPYEVVRDRLRTYAMNGATMSSMSDLLEDMAQHTSAANLLYVLIPAEMKLDDHARLLYTLIEQHGVDVTVLCHNPPTFPGAAVTTVPLPHDDPLLDERAVILLGNYFAAALIAHRDQMSDPDSSEPVYNAVLTYDRRTVVAALHTLLRHVPVY
ncbi:EAL domain-containing protein [Catellatospora chokoriensis]|uniref:EAL domain-containing protein n=1 Tax=Catellatospora chokoriensis TaxID=310353 RepID=A0A8J3K969_9ACTN|nr:EAL domain-containing protein [Catellatospora chokoriensis]GIF94853.1 hypothetical protein Cch02nite_82970 [Catellatospora chokoriensis]